MIVEEEDVSPGGGCFDVTVLASVWVLVVRCRFLDSWPTSGGRYPGFLIEWIFYWIESSQIKNFESIFELNFPGKKIIEYFFELNIPEKNDIE